MSAAPAKTGRHMLAKPERDELARHLETISAGLETALRVEQAVAENAANDAIIKHGRKTYFDVAKALLCIKDSKLFEEQWGTWVTFCRKEVGQPVRNVDHLVLMARQAQQMPGTSLALVLAMSGERGPSRRAMAAASKVKDEDRSLWEQEVAASGAETPAELDRLRRQIEDDDEDEEDLDVAPRASRGADRTPMQLVNYHVNRLKAIQQEMELPEVLDSEASALLERYLDTIGSATAAA